MHLTFFFIKIEMWIWTIVCFFPSISHLNRHDKNAWSLADLGKRVSYSQGRKNGNRKETVTTDLNWSTWKVCSYFVTLGDVRTSRAGIRKILHVAYFHLDIMSFLLIHLQFSGHDWIHLHLKVQILISRGELQSLGWLNIYLNLILLQFSLLVLNFRKLSCNIQCDLTQCTIVYTVIICIQRILEIMICFFYIVMFYEDIAHETPRRQYDLSL